MLDAIYDRRPSLYIVSDAIEEWFVPMLGKDDKLIRDNLIVPRDWKHLRRAFDARYGDRWSPYGGIRFRRIVLAGHGSPGRVSVTSQPLECIVPHPEAILPLRFLRDYVDPAPMATQLLVFACQDASAIENPLLFSLLEGLLGCETYTSAWPILKGDTEIRWLNEKTLQHMNHREKTLGHGMETSSDCVSWRSKKALNKAFGVEVETPFIDRLDVDPAELAMGWTLTSPAAPGASIPVAQEVAKAFLDEFDFEQASQLPTSDDDWRPLIAARDDLHLRPEGDALVIEQEVGRFLVRRARTGVGAAALAPLLLGLDPVESLYR